MLDTGKKILIFVHVHNNIEMFFVDLVTDKGNVILIVH